MLAILTTHPIQYQIPLWQSLASDGRVPFEVWYLTDHAVKASRDREFGKTFAWDLDMLAGYPHRFLDVFPGATPKTFWKCRLRESLRDRLKKSGAKILWIQGWQVAAYWQAVREAKAAGVEVWLRGESNDLAPIPLWKRPVKWLRLNWLFRRVDRFLYIGTANKRLYLKHGVSESRLYSAPYAVDNERFARQAEQIRNQKSEIRKKWGVPEHAFCVLFCGKFIPKKRPMDLVAAARLLLSSTSKLQAPSFLPNKIHLLFVGSGELGAQLRSSCHVVFDAESDQRTEDRERRSVVSGQWSVVRPPASFAGFLNQTEISQAYVAADCLVLPSDFGETWGLVVNEALASGLPCIVSEACGCAADLGQLSGCATFPLGQVKALATILGQKIESKEAKGKFDLNFGQNFSIKNTIASVADGYLKSY